MKLVGGMLKTPLPHAASVAGEVGIGPNGNGGFALAVRLSVPTPGMDQAAAQALVAKAHEFARIRTQRAATST